MTQHYKYLIIGGGMTGDAAVRGIREADKDGSIGLISDEANPPYNRPPLSKGLWDGRPIEKIWRNTHKLGVDLPLGCHATGVDPQAKQVTTAGGDTFTYDKLLLATGGTPRRLPCDPSGGSLDGGVIYFRTVDDYRRLRELADRGGHFAVIGSGFIGSEIAAALTKLGCQVTMIFPDQTIGERAYPADLARFVTDYYRQKGVTLYPGELVQAVERRGPQSDTGYLLRLKSGQEISADAVVAGLGILPNVALAQEAGLRIENGIVVDESLRTSAADIYAAGDVASFYSSALNTWRRVEHEDNANTMGRMAGLAMAGQPVHYDHLPFFYSDLFELGYEGVGELDARLEIVADWQQPMRQGVLYYLRDGRVRGVLQWGLGGGVEEARDLIAAPGPFTAADLIGRLPVY
jgi:3-phenylpropionate/trans-cinnamate dioxygenase ferredoxin reductase component